MGSRTSRGGPRGVTDREDDRDGDLPESLSKDTAFHLLQNGRRRAVVRYLLDREERDEVRMSDVADAVAAWDTGKSVEQLRSDERQRVYIALYQSHLPKLAEHDVIHYDQSAGTIGVGRLAYALTPLLEEGLDASQTLDADETDEGAGGGLLSKLGL